MQSSDSIDRRSIAPMLAARSVYQFYLSLFSVTFSLVAVILGFTALFVLAFGVINLLIHALRLAADAFPAEILDATALQPSRYLPSILRPTPIQAVVGFAILSTFSLIGAALIFAVMKSAMDDRPVGILAILIFAIALGTPALFGADGLVTNWPRFDIGHYLRLATVGLMAVFAVLHLLCALAMRLFRFPRLSARAPRIGLRDLTGKYVGSRWGRFWRGPRAFLPALGRALVRAIGFAAAILIFLLLWDLVVAQFLSKLLVVHLSPDGAEFLSAFGPLAVACIVSTAAALWALFHQPGFRLLNLGWIVLVTLNMPAVTFLKQVQIAIATTPLSKTFAGAVPKIGEVTVLLMAMAFRGYLLAPLRAGFDQFRRNLIRAASEIAADARKPPILLLRAFADDPARTAASFRAFTFAFGGRDPTKSLEEVIAEALFARGPVVALSDPRTKAVPPLGAARDASTDEDWQSHVLRWIEEAQLVVVVIGKTPSLAWEIDQLAARGVLKRTIFITPPGYPSDRSLSAVSEQAAQAIGIDIQGERALGRHVRVVCFDKQRARWTALTSLFANERSYVEAIRIGAGLALHREA